MADAPWLTILGLGEDGFDGLSLAARRALEAAKVVFAPARHLGLLPPLKAECHQWPVPFAEGLTQLDQLRGQQVVVLTSGDPFWYGAGSVLARRYGTAEWHALPGPSCFSWAAARLGWSLERCKVVALHAAPMERLRPTLHPGAQVLVTLRDGAAISELCTYLCQTGFGETQLTVFEALGGGRETRSSFAAHAPETGFGHPVCAALTVQGSGAVVPYASGRPDALFESDGQMTKRPIRALALSALAPRFGEKLWDIGGGSGSIAIEWLLSDPSLTAISIEPRLDRANRLRDNALKLGQDRLDVVHGKAPEALSDLAKPDVVFVGGGLSAALLESLSELAPGTRLVAHAVTLESEAMLCQAQAKLGGSLLRIALSQAEPLGPRLGWKSAYPVVQWQATL